MDRNTRRPVTRAHALHVDRTALVEIACAAIMALATAWLFSAR